MTVKELIQELSDFGPTVENFEVHFIGTTQISHNVRLSVAFSIAKVNPNLDIPAKRVYLKAAKL